MCIRVKFRGSPKALITKDNKETYYLAQLITVGIVISLEILVIGMGDRGSKSVIYTTLPSYYSKVLVDIVDTITVKEQRVDGSSVFIIL